MLDEVQSATTAMADDSVLLDCSPLQPPIPPLPYGFANSETQLTDGPFAEIKEQVGRYYILDCSDLDAALRYATTIPSATYGSVEVGPLMVMGTH